METQFIVAGCLAAALFFYLIYSLICPEKF
jgi:K+-transporting ATPase KdpF subunit